MFQNNNGKIIKDLALNGIKVNKNRNIIMITAIFLTTVLISFFLTAGFSFFTTSYESAQATPGPGADGALTGDRATYDKVLESGEVSWADFVSKCSTTSLHNDEFAGIQTELLAPDQSFYDHNYVTLIEGIFPKDKTQVLISDTLAKKMGIEKLNTSITLKVVILKNGVDTEIEIPVMICGIYKNPLANISGIYEEIYTVPDFVQAHNKEMPQNQNLIYVKMNYLNPILLKSDVYEKLSILSEKVGADFQTSYVRTLTDSLVIALPLLIFVILIMLSGYFLIHNVFSISVASDIRWFGMMKTIGTTKKQIRSIYMLQILILGAVGIFFGILTGYAIGLLLAPEIIGMTDYYLYYKATNLWLVFLFTVLFSWLTVWSSCYKTLKKSAAYSPIEAAKYAPLRRNKVFTAISFALSGIVFIVACNVVFGFQVNKMIERHNQNESRIYHTATFGELSEAYQPISANLPEKIEKLPFIERVDVIYRAKTMPDLIEGLSYKMYESFLAEVKLEGKLKKEMEAIAKAQGDNNIIHYLPNGNAKLEVCGVTDLRLKQEASFFNILDGEIDVEKFKSGNYILYQDVDYLNVTDQQVDQSQKVHAGDSLNVSFYDDETGTYQKKNLTVMAVVEKNDPYGTGDISYSNIVMPDTLFQTIYPNYNERISVIQIISKTSLNKEQVEEITNLVKKEHNTQIRINSCYEDGNYYTRQKSLYTILGSFLTLILGMIGVSNMINTLITDALASNKEILIFQSVGMTRKQLWVLLFKRNLNLCLISLGIISTAGCYITIKVASSTTFTGFNGILFVVSLFLIAMFIVVLCGALAFIMVHQFNKKTIVERLRRIYS